MNYRDNLLRKARKTKRDEDWLTCKKKKKGIVNNIIKKGKSDYDKNLFHENISNVGKFWNCIKDLFPNKRNNHAASTKFLVDNKETSNETEIVSVNTFIRLHQELCSDCFENS